MSADMTVSGEALVVVFLANILVAFAAQYAARRILQAPIGTFRSLAVGIVFFLTAVPVIEAVAVPAGLLNEDGRIAVTGTVFALVVVLALGWALLIGVAVLVVLELLVPVGSVPNPIHLWCQAAAFLRRLWRYLQVLVIFSLRFGLALVSKPSKSSPRLALALVAALNACGVTFVKFGQMLSTRGDSLPSGYADALADLQNNAAPARWACLQNVLDRELGARRDKLVVEEEAIAAASIAQVHVGTIVSTGERVVVKIQRPGAHRQVKIDVDILKRLSGALESRALWAREMRIADLAEGFSNTLMRELDFRAEADNTKRIAAVVASHVKIPAVYDAFRSRRVLVLECISGVTLGCAGPRLAGLDDTVRRNLARALLQTLLDQMLLEGVFHADMHPGNVMLRPDGSLALIDMGSIGLLDRQLRRILLAILIAFDKQDNEAAAMLVLQIVPESNIDSYALRRDLGTAMTIINGPDGFGPNGVGRLFAVFQRHRLALPPAVAGAIRTFGSLQECIRLLDPSADQVVLMRRCLADVSERAFKMARDQDEWLARMVAGAVVGERIPSLVSSVVEQLTNGRILAFQRLEKGLRAWVTHLVSDLTQVFVAGILIIASVMLLYAGGGLMLTKTIPWNWYVAATAALGGTGLILRVLFRSFGLRS